MTKEDEFVQTIAKHYGFPAEDVLASAHSLNLPEGGLVVRLNGLASFAKTYGVDIRSLAEFVQGTGTGIEPWERSHDMSLEDSKRVKDAIASRARPGDWATAILALLDELEQIDAGGA